MFCRKSKISPRNDEILIQNIVPLKCPKCIKILVGDLTFNIPFYEIFYFSIFLPPVLQLDIFKKLVCTTRENFTRIEIIKLVLLHSSIIPLQNFIKYFSLLHFCKYFHPPCINISLKFIMV